MATISIKSSYGEEATLKELLLEGIKEEKKKVEYALSVSSGIISGKEGRYGISSAEFLEKFRTGEIAEDEDTFQWWAEYKLLNILKEKLETLNHVEICRQ